MLVSCSRLEFEDASLPGRFGALNQESTRNVDGGLYHSVVGISHIGVAREENC